MNAAMSPRSPLGHAANGSRVGEKVTYVAPNGLITVSIIATEPAA